MSLIERAALKVKIDQFPTLDLFECLKNVSFDSSSLLFDLLSLSLNEVNTFLRWLD
jgi:hypothetical protein